MNTTEPAGPPLRVPNPDRLGSVQALCDLPDPYGPFPEALFRKAMMEIIRWHAENSGPYCTLLAESNFSEDDFSRTGDLSRIPFIPAEFFKEHELLSIPREKVAVHLTSSGTTGQKSQIFFDEWSISSAQRMVDRIFAANGWVSDSPSNYLLYSYEPQPNLKVGTSFTDHFLCKYSPPRKVYCALRATGSGSHEFDLFGCIARLLEFESSGLPVRIFGFPAFLHFTLKRMKSLGLPPLRLHPESLVFLGGGWKANESESIRKDILYANIEAQLGIPNHRLSDGFGSVEHCVPYIECRKHNFHVPVWSRVLIRDVATLEVLGYGKPGFLQFVSPYITSVPAHSVMMGDLASLHPAEECGCGTPTPWFQILGRAGVSKNKSCAVAATELLKGMS
jgi:phenylacetate-coenzyme A ligase PaaK-like adenylate-forming protein